MSLLENFMRLLEEGYIPEGSPLYEAIEYKLKAEGIKEGTLRELRWMLVRFTTLHYPDLVSQAQQQAEQVKSPEQLRAILYQLFETTTDQEARVVLMS